MYVLCVCIAYRVSEGGRRRFLPKGEKRTMRCVFVVHFVGIVYREEEICMYQRFINISIFVFNFWQKIFFVTPLCVLCVLLGKKVCSSPGVFTCAKSSTFICC